MSINQILFIIKRYWRTYLPIFFIFCSCSIDGLISETFLFKNKKSGSYEISLKIKKSNLKTLKFIDNVIPSSSGIIDELSSDFRKVSEKISYIPGIKKIKFSHNNDGRNFSINFDFENIEGLKKALEVIFGSTNSKSYCTSILLLDQEKLYREVKIDINNLPKDSEDKNLFGFLNFVGGIKIITKYFFDTPIISSFRGSISNRENKWKAEYKKSMGETVTNGIKHEIFFPNQDDFFDD